jgi:thioredoxin 1
MDALVVDVSESNWDSEVAASDLPVLVDFWAPWCGPCKAIEPTVASLAREYAGQIKVAKVNVDDNKALRERFGVRGIPALVLVRGGQQPVLLLGRTRTRIADELDAHLA